jgi:hypothetical protein
MATIILTTQMILDYAEKNPTANASDILEHFNSLKNKYVNRNGDPLQRGSIQNILSNTFDLTPTVPKGYQKASDLFMSSVDDTTKNRLPILKGGYFKMSYRSNADGTKGSQLTRLIDKLLKPKILGSGRGGNTLYFKTPTKEDFKLINRLSTGFDRLKPDTVNRMKDFHNLYKNDYKKASSVSGLPSWDRISKNFPNLTRSQAGLAFARLAQWYKGQPFKNEELKGLARLPKTGEKMLKAASDAPFGNFYNKGLNEISLATIDEQLGRESGTFKSFKDRARNILKKNNIPLYDVKKTNPYGFNINEIVGTNARARSKAVEFSQFIDVMEGKLNQTTLARYQTDLGIATEAIEKSPKLFEKNPKLFKEIANKMNTKSRGLESKYGIRLAKIRPPSNVDKYYSPNRLKQLKDQGININTASKRAGYTFEMPRGAMTVKEFGDKFSKDPSKLLKQFTAAVRGSGKCQTIIKNAFMASGGRVPYAGGQDACARAVEANPEAAAKVIVNEIPESTGPINKVKNAASKFLNFAKADYNLMGKMGGFGKGAALVGLGAAAAGVKEFFSDDPTSYLSNEKQQKNLLIDMVTEPIAEPTEKPAILEAQMPVLGATLLAGTIPGAKDTYLDARTGRGPKGPAGSGLPANIVNKPVGKLRAALGINKGVFGKGLASLGTPAGMLATEPFFIGNQIAEGDSIGEIATNPMNYLGAAFASPLTKMATKNVSPTMANIMRLGLSPARLMMLSRLGKAGLLISGGIAGYNLFKDYRNKEGFFEKDNVGPARFDQQTGIGGINFD